MTIPLDLSKVGAVLFDVDGTLYRQAPLRALMAVELSLLALAPRKAFRHLAALRSFRRAQEQLRGRQNIQGIHGQLAVAASASGLSVAEVQALVDEWIMTRPLKYLQLCRASGLDGLLATLDRLALKAGVLSDYPAEAKLRALGVDGRFWPVLCSTDPEIDAFKPNPRGFLRACELWDMSPSQVLFVGDRADVDAAGASAAGMPCAIVGRAIPADSSGRFTWFRDFERLCRVFDGH